MKYLTPQQYRFADDGLVGPATTGITDATLARHIARAEAQIDAFMGFDPQLGGFEPHVLYTQRGFDARTRKLPSPIPPVPVRNVQRYLIHISNASPTGAPFVATINPGDAIMNNLEGYVEVVPLQAITYSLSPVLMQLGARPPLVLADLEMGYYIPRLGVRLYSDDGVTYRAPFGFWATSYAQAVSNRPATLPPVPPVVYLDGVAVPSGQYTGDPVEGAIQFNSAQSLTATVTLDATATIPDWVAWATSAQVTWLLAQRQLTQMGGRVLEQVRAGEQQVKRHIRDVKHDLCDEALGYLRPYKAIAMA